MTTIATRNLTGAALDWAVAKAEGFQIRCDPMGFGVGHANGGYWTSGGTIASPMLKIGAPGKLGYQPSSDWSQAGPIIEREGIGMRCLGSAGDDQWAAWIDQDMACFAPTPLVAAMRCYVASRLGESVDVPEDLA